MVGRDLKMKLLRLRIGTESKVRVLTDTPPPLCFEWKPDHVHSKKRVLLPFLYFSAVHSFYNFFNFIIYKNFLQCLKRKVLYYQK